MSIFWTKLYSNSITYRTCHHADTPSGVVAPNYRLKIIKNHVYHSVVLQRAALPSHPGGLHLMRNLLVRTQNENKIRSTSILGWKRSSPEYARALTPSWPKCHVSLCIDELKL